MLLAVQLASCLRAVLQSQSKTKRLVVLLPRCYCQCMIESLNIMVQGALMVNVFSFQITRVSSGPCRVKNTFVEIGGKDEVGPAGLSLAFHAFAETRAKS